MPPIDISAMPARKGASAPVWGTAAVFGTPDARHINRARLEHRTALMRPGSADPDLIEELARSQLMLGAPNQVAVPRAAH